MDEHFIGNEVAQLTGFLDLQRDIIVRKCSGLTRQQLATPLPPSTLTLAGIVYHLALVEESWLEVRFSGMPEREPWAGVDWDADRDWEFHAATELEPEALLTRYAEACQRSRDVVGAAVNLEVLSRTPNRHGADYNLRWVLLHLIEETARHAGHTDLIRESIDGSVGE